jgi:hypothetical protein
MGVGVIGEGEMRLGMIKLKRVRGKEDRLCIWVRIEKKDWLGWTGLVRESNNNNNNNDKLQDK